MSKAIMKTACLAMMMSIIHFFASVCYGQGVVSSSPYETERYKYEYSNIDRSASFCGVTRLWNPNATASPDLVIYPFGYNKNSAWYVTRIDVPEISCKGLSIFMGPDYIDKQLVIANFGADESLESVSLNNPFAKRWDKDPNSTYNNSTIVVANKVFDEKCPNLRLITLDGVKRAGSKAFYGMKSGRVVCRGSGEIYNGSVPEIQDDTFCQEAYENVDLYVNGLQFYLNAPGWRNFKKIHDISELVTGMGFTNAPYSIYVNGSLDLFHLGNPGSAMLWVNPKEANKKLLVWSSSDENICTVSNGVITGHNVGEAVITVESPSGVTASCNIRVLKPAESISVSSPDLCLINRELILGIGETGTLNAHVYPDDATDKSIRWIGSDYFSIDSNGRITGIKRGSPYGSIVSTPAKISGSSAIQGERISIKVVEPVDCLIMDYSNVTMNVSDTIKLGLSSVPFVESTINNGCLWTFSDTDVADWISKYYHNNQIVAKSPGECIVTAHTAKGVKASCRIKVIEVPVSEVVIDKEALGLSDNTLEMRVGDTKKINATVRPANATNKSLAIESSRTGIVSIYSGGYLKASSLGEATVTAYSKANPEIRDSIKVSVIATPAASITLNKTGATLMVAETLNLKAAIQPETTTDKSVKWMSSDESVAKVDSNGQVAAVKIGKTVITATAASGVSAECAIEVIATPARYITLNQTEATLQATETIDLIATVLPETTTDKSVKWKSSDESVAKVDSNGKVTAVKIGKAKITATATSGVSAECAIEVIATPARYITLNQTEVTLQATETIDLIATILPETTTDKSVVWESGNEEIATVDSNGRVNAVAVGIVTITAHAASGVSAECTINVVSTPASSITLNTTEALLKATESVNIVATIFPETTTDKSLNWESNNESVAMVDANGKVTAMAVGEATITVTAMSGVSAECVITVIETPAGGIVIDKNALGITGDNLDMRVGEIAVIKVMVTPETTTDKSVTYGSSNPDVASVDENGYITAHSLGVTTINITSNSKPDVKARLFVTVAAPLALSIEVEPTSVEDVIGHEIQLIAKIIPEPASGQTLEWESSNSEVARVSSSGLVKILKEGTAVIEVRTTDGSNLIAACNVSGESSIESILADVDSSTIDIYSLQGICIRHNVSLSDIKALSPGFYIIAGKKVFIK